MFLLYTKRERFSYFFVQSFKIKFSTLLIFVPGAKTPAGVRGWGDPAGAKAPRKLPATPAESEAHGTEINRQISKNVERKKVPLKVILLGHPLFFCAFQISNW
jgi:hypothetical protein